MKTVATVAVVLAMTAYALHVDYGERSRRALVRGVLHDFRATLAEKRSPERYTTQAIPPNVGPPPASTVCYHGTADPACYTPLDVYSPTVGASGYCTGPSPFDCTEGTYEWHDEQLRRLREIERRVEDLLIRSGAWRPA